MLEQLLAKNEGKTLEFQENTNSIQKIVHTAIAFANTAGGLIVIGVNGETKEVTGLENVLKDEERVANAIADSIFPQLLPNFQFSSWRGRDVLLVTVSHSVGPFYLKAKGENEGTYVRMGSTNRIADEGMIAEIRRLKEHTVFDQLPDRSHSPSDLDFELATTLFNAVGKPFSNAKARLLELVIPYQSEVYPTKGGLLLFGKDRDLLFSDPIARLLRFEGNTKQSTIDELEINSPLPLALDEILKFIRRNTATGSKIGPIRREEIAQYPPIVVREAIVNALIHTDYSTKRSSLQVAIFDDRIEITNAGCLPFGLSLEAALAGVSQLRNKVIGRVFRELRLSEQWGSGLSRMIHTCREQQIALPKFEELDHFFRATLYPRTKKSLPSAPWHIPLLNHIQKHGPTSAAAAEKIWNVTRRTASSRLKKMCEEGLLVELSTGSFDPHKTFILADNPGN